MGTKLELDRRAIARKPHSALSIAICTALLVGAPAPSLATGATEEAHAALTGATQTPHARLATITVTNTNDSGPGSLRAAIVSATGNNAPDTIDFDPALFSGGPRTITLTSGELDVSGAGDNDSFNIAGPGANLLTISGNGSSRVFAAIHDHNDHSYNGSNTSSVTISSVTLSNGHFAYSYGNDDGYGGGAISSEYSGSLTLDHVVISNSQATGDYVSGGGGVYFLDKNQDFSLVESTVSSNSATHVSGTGAGSYGGGLDVYAATINMVNSTLADNASSRQGGGARLIAKSSLSITNGTFSGNNSGSSANGIGGGGGVAITASTGTLKIVNSTFVNNAFVGNAGDATMGGGALRIRNSTVTLQNNLIAGNSSSNSGNAAILLTNAGVANGSNNIVTGTVDVYQATSHNNLSGTITSVSGVGALADNGGAVQTVSITSTSAAVNAGSTAGAPSDDARGYTRDSSVDIGAFEYGATPPVTNAAPVVSNLDGDSVSFVEDGADVLLDSGTAAQVADSDSPDFDGGNVTVSIVTNRVAGEDVLGIQNQGSGAGQIGVSGSNVSYAGTTIGSFTGGTGTSDLVIGLNANATPGATTALVRALTYRDSNSVTPTTATRTVRVTVDDGDGGTSTAADVSVAVQAVDDAPVLVAGSGTSTFVEGDTVAGTPVAVDSGLTVQDIDNSTLASAVVAIVGNFQSGQDVLAFSNDGGTMGNIAPNYNASTGVLTLTSSGASATLPQWQSALRSVTYANSSDDPDTSTRTVSFTVNDGSADSFPAQHDVGVTATNDAPSVSGLPASVAITEDTTGSLDIAASSFADPDSASITVTLSVGSGSIGLANPAPFSLTATGNGSSTVTLTGAVADINTYLNTPSNATYTPAADLNGIGADTLSISANDHDGSGDVALGSVAIDIGAVNDAPVNQVPGAQNLAQDGSLIFSTGNGNAISISDVDAGSGVEQATLDVAHGTLTLSGTTGLTFSAGDGSADASMSFSGTLADINNALQGLVYAPGSGYNGSDTLNVTSNDQGNTGSGGAQSDSDSVALNVSAPVPAVTGVSATTADGTYKLGDTVIVTVTFDYDVLVDTSAGVPTLDLETGSVDEAVIYGAGSGTNVLLFQYTVQAGDLSADLDYTSVGALHLNGGTITNDSGTENATLTLPTVGSPHSLAGEKDLIIDGVAPTVASVDVPADGTCVAGDTLDFAVHYSENVTVDTGGGTPRLAITLDDGSTVYADYVSGSGSDTLVFRHTVATGELDTDGIDLGTSVQANGGTLRDAAGNDAVATLNGVASTTGVLIDAVAPTVSAVSVPSDGNYMTGTMLDFGVEFSEPVIVDTTNGAPRLVLDIGGATVYADYVSGSGTDTLMFSYTVQASDHDGDGIGLGANLDFNGASVRDAAGNDADPALGALPSTARVLVNAIPAYAAVPAGGWPAWLLAMLSLLGAALARLTPRGRRDF